MYNFFVIKIKDKYIIIVTKVKEYSLQYKKYIVYNVKVKYW